ncbi:MAG: hypothetical protein ABIR67_10090 [Gaiellaceae bacterium]
MRLVAAIAVAFGLAVPAAAAPPGAGVLIPGRSLGDVELGATKAEVERLWGRAYGVCRGCPRETWYFNYYAFQPRGAGVEWRDGRAVAVFTIYQPLSWRTPKGLKLGDAASQITGSYGPMKRQDCAGYSVYLLAGRNATTAFYVLGERLWAFGLSRPSVPLCR